MKLTWGQCECTRPKRYSATALVSRYRVSRVQKGAPPADVKMNRRQIVRDMVRNRRHLMIDGMRSMTAFLSVYFRETLNDVCNRALELSFRPKSARSPHCKAVIDVELGDSENEEIWKTAIEEVLGTDADVRLVVSYTPIVQSVAARANSRVALFLGDTEPPQASVNILRRAQAMATQVTRINETTRNNLARTITQALAEGQTVAETVQTIKRAIPEIAESRIPTIARTEIGNAVDAGTKEALKNSTAVTHVSVVGCKAREANSPQIDGFSTCNYQDLPKERIEELIFHPNHTGAIVASGFVGDR
jgi:hypothetical protein